MRKPLTPLRPEIVQVDEQGRPILGSSRVDLFGLLPGEQAEALVGKRRKGVHPGWVTRLVHPSEHRVEPRCPHFAACGGCTLQHLAYSQQVALKTSRLEAALRARGAEVLPPVPAPSSTYYRSKVELSFMPSGEPGFRRRGRFDQGVPVEECFIAPAGNRDIFQLLREWSRGRRGWNPRTMEGELRYFVLRRSATTGQWLAVVVTAPGDPPQELADRLGGLGATGVVWVEQTSVASAIVPDAEGVLYGSPLIEERLEELRFSLSWRSFFQSNPRAYLNMLGRAREWVGQPGYLLDLFCGIGTIGLFLNPQRLVGVESVEAAVSDARANALANGRSGEFHCALSQDWEELDCDLLVLDPPRSGCHPKLVRKLQEKGPERLLYISCNPERLLAELEELSAYQVERAQLFDFFPHTHHVEALTMLKRIQGDAANSP